MRTLLLYLIAMLTGVTAVAQNFHEDQFDDGSVSVSGSWLDKMIAYESNCGELKLEMHPDSTLPTFKPILWNFPGPTDVSTNSIVQMRVRSANSFDLRIDMHDGTNSTNGATNGRITQTVPADINNYTTLTFNFPTAAFTETSVNINAVTRLNIFLDPSNADFPGPIYIDFISIGTATGTGNAACKTDIDAGPPFGDGSSFYEEQFDDNSVNNFGSNASELDITESLCGETKMTMAAAGNLGTFTPIQLFLPAPIDMTGNAKVVIRTRSERSFFIRIDLKDATNGTNGANGKITRLVNGDLNDWSTVAFEYPTAAFTDNGVDITQIEQINIFLDPGVADFPGTIYFDYISFGEPTGVGNATTRTDIDACVFGDGSSHYEEQFDDNTLNNFGSNASELTMSESACGETKMQMAPAGNLGTYTPIQYFPTAPVDMTGNAKIVVRYRAATSFDLRIDLVDDGGNSTNGPNGAVTRTLTADLNNWYEASFEYFPPAISDNSVDITQIDQLNIFLDPGVADFPDSLYIDFIAFGEPSGTGNATTKTDIDVCTTGLLEDMINASLDVYPNPASASVTVAYESLSSDVGITVSDLTGQVVATANGSNTGVSFDVSELAPGLYIVSVTTDNGVAATRKIVVQ